MERASAPLAPGIHDLPAEIYHADPCPEPSLSGSVAVPLVHQSPRHAWWAHPRLNPAFERTEESKFDLGTVSHKLLLGKGGDVVVVKADDWRTSAAKAARDDARARAAGKTPILERQMEEAERMADNARQYLDAAGEDLSRGVAERTLVWREGNIWCRGMTDWLANDLGSLLDYKTTGASANPDDLERHVFDMNYHLKMAFYERGLAVLDPANVGRRKLALFFQENFEPYTCSLVTISEAGMTIGRKQATYAIRRWQQCMATGRWPAYPKHRVALAPPPWVESKWLTREMSDAFATGETAPTLILPPEEAKPLPLIGD